MKVKKKKYLLIHSVTFIELGRIHTKFHEDRSNLLIVTALQPDRQMLKAQIQTGCCLTRSFIILSFKNSNSNQNIGYNSFIMFASYCSFDGKIFT